uniref:Uncharacterized protein n=1 Tax=Hevea brasiliensis TaxID=3981 RepID=W6JNH9_HEVBR|nr:putative uncharacterized protein [Hevea brasiliensis]
MDLLVSQYVFSLALSFSIALLVAFRAGQARDVNAINFEEKVNDLTIATLKEQIVSKIEILFRVYKDTTGDVNLPTGVNPQEVAERVFFSVDNIHWLNQIYLELVNQGTQSPHFAQALDYVLHFGGMVCS